MIAEISHSRPLLLEFHETAVGGEVLGGGDGDNENKSLVTRIAYSRPVPKFVPRPMVPG